MAKSCITAICYTFFKQTIQAVFAGLFCISIFISLSSFANTGENQHQLTLRLTDFSLPLKATIKLNVFINGGEKITLVTQKAADGNSSFYKLDFKTATPNYTGIAEINIEGIGTLPFVIYKDTQVLNVSKNFLVNSQPLVDDAEQKALNEFLTIYRGYENMLAQYTEMIVSPFGVLTADSAAYKQFLGDYVTFRNQFNLFFTYARQQYPQSYVARIMSKIFLQEAAIYSWKDVQQNYFSKWDFFNEEILNSPLFDRQLEIYFFLSKMPGSGNEMQALDNLYKPLTKYGVANKEVNEHIRNYCIIQFFSHNKKGENDNLIEYYYHNWIALQLASCSEESTNSNEKYQAAFFKRLANISKVREGNMMPSISGFTLSGQKVDLANTRKKNKPFVIVYIWSSSCSHCKDFSPQLIKLAQKHNGKVEVLAYAIDKADTKKDWRIMAEAHAGIANWTDVAETEDVTSTGISDICYMGTPGIFLLDKKGKILSKTADSQVLESIIVSK